METVCFSYLLILLLCMVKGILAATVVNLNTGPVIHGMISTFNCTVSPNNVTVNTMTLSRVSVPSSIIYVHYPRNPANGPDPQYASRITGEFIAADLTLTVAMNTTLSDSGEYRCLTITSEGARSVNKNVSVLYSPDIMIEKTSDGEYTCSSGPSFPQANLTWSCTGSAHCEQKDLTTTASSSVNGTFETVLTMACVNNGTQDSTCYCETGHLFGAAKSVEIQSQEPPGGQAPLVAALVTLIIISFIGSLTLCIFVCIKFPDEKVSLKGVVDWICITVVFFCVILGNICGGVLWRMIDLNQNTGIIALAIILIDVGIFILGIVIGIIKKCIEQKPESDEALRDILVKLPNIVLSVATFGGVSAGIAIAFSCKNGKVRRASITPEETQASPRKVTPTNSENSVTSQSKVPLQEDVSQTIQEKNDDIPMQKPKKKKKKKTEGKYKEPPIQKVATPRKLPPLKT